MDLLRLGTKVVINKDKQDERNGKVAGITSYEYFSPARGDMKTTLGYLITLDAGFYSQDDKKTYVHILLVHVDSVSAI